MKVFILSVLVLYLANLRISNCQHTKLSTEKSTVFRIPTYQSIAYFSYFVDEIRPGQDLIASFTPIDWWADPNVFESASNQFPNNPANSEHTCESFGLEVCTIPEKEIAQNKTFYFGVFCYLPCTFRIEILYEEEKVLKLSEPKTIVLDRSKQEGEIIKLELPEDLEADHILIIATPRDYDKITKPVALYLQSHDNIPTTSSFIQMGQLYWREGLILSINKQNGIYCKGCVYKMLLVSQESIVVDFIAKPIGFETNITFGQSLFDFITGDQIAYYLMRVDDSNFNLAKDSINFELAPYSGNPDIYVNPGSRPSVLDDYRWKSQQLSGEILKITPEDRNEVFKPEGEQVYYIAVQSHGGSTYSLSSYLSKNQKDLKFGFSETGYIFSGETLNFLLAVARPEGQNSTINIILESISGNVDLYIKSCPYNYELKSDVRNCTFSSWEIEHRNMIDYMPGMYYAAANHPAGNELISFENAPPICIKEICYYSVSVYGSLNQTISKYSLTASHSNKHNVLQENIPMRNTVEEGEYQFYKFTLLNAASALSVHFQLTPISGSSEVYSSKSMEFPNVNEHQKVACGCSHTITYCGFNPNDKPLEGTYYLAVYGFTHSKYSITAFTRTQNNIILIQLINGVIQKFAFPEGGGSPLQEVYFKFEINSDSSFLEFELALNPIKGKSFKMFLSNSFLPEEDSAQWSTYSNQIIIDTSDPLFSTHAFYGIKVVPYDPNDLDQKVLDTRNWQFTIQFTLSDRRYKTLSENIPTHYQVSKLRPAYFQFSLPSSSQEISVKISEFTQELSMYLNWDTKLIYPDQSNYALKGSKIMKLHSEDIKKACQSSSSLNLSDTCSFYVGVFTERKENIGFTLTIVKADSLILLKEGVPDQSPYPAKGKYIEYMLLPTIDEIVFSLETKFKLEISMIIINTEVNPNQKDWANRNDLKSVETFVKFKTQIFSVTKESLSKIFQNCVIIIRIKNNDFDVVDQEDYFTISTSGQIMTLLDSHIRYEFISSQSPKYYKIEAKNENFRVLLSPLSTGNPELFINNARDGFPTTEKYLKKSADPMFPSISIENGSPGEYYLMVISEKGCTYSLIFTTIQNNVYEILPNIPLTVNLDSKENSFYLFLKETSKNTLRVLLAKERGYVDFYININKVDADFEFPNPEKHDENNDNRAYCLVSKPQEDSSHNQIIVFVKPRDHLNDKLTFLIAEDGSFASLIPGISFTDIVSQDRINKYIFENTQGNDISEIDISIIVTIYTGNAKIVASNTDKIENPIWQESKKYDKKGSTIVLNINKNDKNFKNVLYFGVQSRSQEDCEYSVKIEIQKSFSHLSDGVLAAGTLDVKGSKNFVFTSPHEYTEKKIITLTLAVIPSQENVHNHLFMFPELTIDYVNDQDSKGIKHRQSKVDVRESSSVRIYRFVSKKGLYFVNLNNAQSQSINFIITMNSQMMQLLPFNNEIMAYLGVGQQEIYELSIPTQGTLHLSFVICFGQIEIKGAEDTEFKEGVFNKEFKEDLQGKELITNSNYLGSTYSIDANPGKFYIKIISKEGLLMFNPLSEDGFNPRAEESAYKISTHFTPKAKMNPFTLFINPNRNIKALTKKKGEYEIEWENIKLMDKKTSKLLKNVQIENEIYLASNEKGLSIGSKCEIKPGQEFLYIIENGEGTNNLVYVNP